MNKFSNRQEKRRSYREEGDNKGRYGRNERRERNGKVPFSKFRKKEEGEQRDTQKRDELRARHYSKKKQLAHRIKKTEKADAELRLNRYISMSGVCSRRDADVLIAEGRVKVNNVIVQAIGVKVKRSDKVEVDGKTVVPEKKVYIVLNKPKDYVTTVEDPQERKTVMALIADACKERVFPVGRLDRQTTGVLLFTNDGDLSKKLTHPKYEHKKIYHVFLNKPLALKDMEAISTGVELEDGEIKADEISYVSTDQTQVGIEIHSGRNRIVRRIFEHLGYQIEKLDRVYFAGITKKNLPRGRWRFLTSEEVRVLKIY
ncbi:pseudouridine synthase [Odoribacter lunatus]|uniref:pseudouridine synthase n=1 Tax=Odoribacter lunatus TaxID=2941335 RepID=UPI003B9713CF